MEQWCRARKQIIRLGDPSPLAQMMLVKQEHAEAQLESEDELNLEYPDDELD